MKKNIRLIHAAVNKLRWVSDGNKSLYLVFVGVVFSVSWTAFIAARTAGRQHLNCF
jgi:hypothetical protein